MTYTDRQSRFALAFAHSGTSCVIECECGRVHFVSCSGHGDYEPGELEDLRDNARLFPKKYVEHADHDTIDITYPLGCGPLVPDCPCGKADRIAEQIEKSAHDIARYIGLWMELRQNKRDEDQVDDDAALAAVASISPNLAKARIQPY